MNEIRAKMAKGAAWMVALKFADNGVGIISTLILARLLTPSDFGTLAMAMSIVALLELLSAFGFDTAIIQRPSVTRHHLDTVWTFNIIFAVATFAALLAVAEPAAAFYGEPRLMTVMQVLAAGWLIRGFENIGVVTFRKELDFAREFSFMLIKRVAVFAVTIPLAFWLKSYWALVIGIVAGKALSTLISFVVHPFRPRLGLSGARDLLQFSTWLFINNGLYFLNQRLSDFVIGRISGAHALGLYNLSHEIATMPTIDLVAPINRAVYPGYTKMANDTQALGDTFISTIGLVALAAFPAGCGIAAVAGPLVNVALGPDWVDAVPLVMLLSLYGAVASLGTNAGYIYLAVGRPRILTAFAAARAIVLVPAIIVACLWKGPLGAAWAVLMVEILFRPFNFAVVLRILQLRTASLLSQIWRPILASGVMYLCVRHVLLVVSGESLAEQGVQLAVSVLSGVLAYTGTLLLLWRLVGAPLSSETIVLRTLRTTKLFRFVSS